MCEQTAHTKGKRVGRRFAMSGTQSVAAVGRLLGVAVIVRVPTLVPSSWQA